MTRLWNLSQRVKGNAPPGPPPPPPPPELVDPTMGEPTPYPSRPVRPVAQLAARVGLWAAVGFGCLGGLVGMFRPTQSGAEAVADGSSTDAEIVPAPVAGSAERIVEEWLVATEDDQDRLNALFLDPPDLNEVVTEGITLLDVTTVAGERLNEGYWTVTVAADLIETIPGEGGASEEGEATEDGEPPVSTWYVELGIVGEVGRGLAALTTPAIVPPPAAVESRWRPIPADPYRPEDGDQLAATVEGFLNALLAGDGDPSRYLAPHVEMHAADPAPFVGLDVIEMAAEETEDGAVRIWIDAVATTAGDARHVVSYEVVATERADRWEIRELWGAPTVEPVPEDEEAETPTTSPESTPDDGAEGTEGTGETGTEGSSTDDTTEGTTGEEEVPEGSGTEGDGAETGADGSTTTAPSDPLASDQGE